MPGLARLLLLISSALTAALGLALLAPRATAQESPPTPKLTHRVAGHVVSFDGKPAGYAAVTVFDDRGSKCTEFVTDARGRFDHRSERAIGHLRIQTEGVTVKVGFADRDPAQLRVSFENVPFFTLRGRILDPGGLPMSATDILVRGEFDDTIVNVTTDHDGRYHARVGRTAWSLIVDPLGLAWTENREVGGNGMIDIDLRTVHGDFFSIEGRVLDHTGSPIGDAVIHGASRQHVRLERRVRKDGSFLLWSRRPLDYLLVTQDGEPIALRLGAIESDISLEIDARHHGFVTVKGRVLDKLGAGVPYANVLPADAAGRALTRLRMLARCDPDGHFTARVPRTIPNLFAWLQPQGSAVAPWQPDQAVKLVLR